MTTTKTQLPRTCLELFIDGDCAFCRDFATRIARLDRRGRIEIHSFRHDTRHVDRGIAAEALERRMHVFSLSTRRISAGAGALRDLCRTLPLLWPLLLPLCILQGSGLAEPLYDLLARHRLVLGGRDACSNGSCQLPSPLPLPRSLRQRTALIGAALALVGVLAWHFLATLVHIMPLTSAGVVLGESVTGHIYPLFSQRWTLFAPEPPLQNLRLNVMCRDSTGNESPWLDPDADLIRTHARLRLTPSGYLLRMNRAAIAGVVGTQDDLVDELFRKFDQASQEEKELLKATLRDQAINRLNDQRFLYRLAEHYCDRWQGSTLAATRIRMIFETIPKFSKRNQPTPDMQARELVMDWRPRGSIDEFVAAKVIEVRRAFDDLKIEDLKTQVSHL